MSSDAYRGRYVRHFNTICGTCHTDFVFERFEDRILLVISQLQGLGSIVSISGCLLANLIYLSFPLLSTLPKTLFSMLYLCLENEMTRT